MFNKLKRFIALKIIGVFTTFCGSWASYIRDTVTIECDENTGKFNYGYDSADKRLHHIEKFNILNRLRLELAMRYKPNAAVLYIHLTRCIMTLGETKSGTANINTLPILIALNTICTNKSGRIYFSEGYDWWKSIDELLNALFGLYEITEGDNEYIDEFIELYRVRIPKAFVLNSLRDKVADEYLAPEINTIGSIRLHVLDKDLVDKYKTRRNRFHNYHGHYSNKIDNIDIGVFSKPIGHAIVIKGKVRENEMLPTQVIISTALLNTYDPLVLKRMKGEMVSTWTLTRYSVPVITSEYPKFKEDYDIMKGINNG